MMINGVAHGPMKATTTFQLHMRSFNDGDTLTIADEMLTPDSSRFWPAATYRSGGAQASLDKQFVRDYVERLGWDKRPPAPRLPGEIVEGLRSRYLDIFHRLTGRDAAL
jgi:phosphoribosylaminoimidazole-succinocarboxamide synthase